MRKSERRLRKRATDIVSLYEIFRDSKVAEGRAAGTLENYDIAFDTFREYLDEDGVGRDVEAIDAEILRDYAAYLLNEKIRHTNGEQGLSRRAASDYLRMMRTFFAFIYDEEYIDRNPFDRVKAIEYYDPDIQILTADELNRLLVVPNRRMYDDFRDYVLMTFLIDTMARIKESCTLRRADVDFAGRTVMFRAKNTKTRKMRVVPMQSRTANLLRELIRENDDVESEYIFLANHGGVLRPNQFRKQLRQYAKEAGITKRVYPHLFRHTSATMFLEAGGDSQYLKMILGHNDEKMIDRYSHLRTKSVSEAHARYSPLNQLGGKLQKQRKVKR